MSFEAPKTPEHQKSEIERKYLLNSKEDADKIVEKIQELYPEASFIEGFSETSYYYPSLSVAETRRLISLVAKEDQYKEYIHLLDAAPEDLPAQLRFRRRHNLEDTTFTLSVKVSEDPLHDIERLEFEIPEIKQRFLDVFAQEGVEPDSEWQSARRRYQIDEGTTIDVQNVTGYGWTLEIESDGEKTIEEIAGKLGIIPVDKKTLGAMYETYRKNWKEYVGDDGEGREFTSEDWNAIQEKTGEQIPKNKVTK